MGRIDCRVGEINIICTDAGKSLRFYRDILGFDVLGEERGCWHLACGDTKFLLMPFAGGPGTRREYCAEPAFSVDLLVPDLRATRELFESEGVDFVEGFQADEERFFIRDPDGLVLEIIQS
jgi:catechol 2,3-dioxygenase-like lactoylglutathione lyase family enzyme